MGMTRSLPKRLVQLGTLLVDRLKGILLRLTRVTDAALAA
jgi:hypothetical protein